MKNTFIKIKFDPANKQKSIYTYASQISQNHWFCKHLLMLLQMNPWLAIQLLMIGYSDIKRGQSTRLFLYSDGLNCQWFQRTSVADGSMQIETCRWQTAEGTHQKTQMRLRGRSPQSERRALPCWTNSSMAISTRRFLLSEWQARQSLTEQTRLRSLCIMTPDKIQLHFITLLFF